LRGTKQSHNLNQIEVKKEIDNQNEIAAFLAMTNKKTSVY